MGSTGYCKGTVITWSFKEPRPHSSVCSVTALIHVSSMSHCTQGSGLQPCPAKCKANPRDRYPRAKANCTLLTGYIILRLAWGKEAERWFKESRGWVGKREGGRENQLKKSTRRRLAVDMLDDGKLVRTNNGWRARHYPAPGRVQSFYKLVWRVKCSRGPVLLLATNNCERSYFIC